MPEGDTVLRTARRLDQALGGRPVSQFVSRYAHLTVVDDQSPIAGRTITRVSARGKHLLFALSGDLLLRTHLRMNGSWHLYRPGERWRRPESALRVLLVVAPGSRPSVTAPTPHPPRRVLDAGAPQDRLGGPRERADVATDPQPWIAVGFDIAEAEWLSPAQLERQPALAALGPDLLAPADEFDSAEARRRFRRHGNRAVAEALLDQRVVAGAGNVFKSEILFLAGLDPFRPVADLTDDDLDRLVEIARSLLAANVTPAAGSPGIAPGPGIATHFGLRRTTGMADPAANLWVYGRTGEPCRRCAAAIAWRRQGEDARGTWWCPTCQR